MPGDPAMSARAHPHPWPRSSGPFFLLACRATASQSLQSDESQFEQRHPYKGIPSGLGLRRAYMPNPRTTEARPHIADVGFVMESAVKCYAMADQCEEQAATTHRTREILLELAANWRSLGDTLRGTLKPH